MEKSHQQLLNEFMQRPEIKAMSQEEQSAIFCAIHNIVVKAQTQVAQDAEKAIKGLFTFSVGR